MFFEVRKARVFVALAEAGSFCAAAERLNVAQPWVSTQLKQLEEVLGLILVDRTKGRFLRLTDSGTGFYPIAKQVVDSCIEADLGIRDLKNQARGTLVLGLDPVTLYIPERNRLVTQLIAQQPAAELKILSQSPAQLFDGLRSGDLDVILTSAPSPYDDKIEFLPLYSYELHLLIPKARTNIGRGSNRGTVAGAHLLTLGQAYHPPMFTCLKTTLSQAGVKWTECPEGSFQALIRYSAMLGIPTLAPDFSHTMPEMKAEMDIKKIVDVPMIVRWGLMRRAGCKKASVTQLWNMADRMSVRQPDRSSAWQSKVSLGHATD